MRQLFLVALFHSPGQIRQSGSGLHCGGENARIDSCAGCLDVGKLAILHCLVREDEGNYPLTDIYRKWHVAQDAVDLGGAIILTSAGKAREDDRDRRRRSAVSRDRRR